MPASSSSSKPPMRLKSLRPPFRDPGQRGAEAECRQRHQQRFRPVGRQAGRSERERREWQPSQQHVRPSASPLTQQRLEHRRADQPKRQHHAAVQIGPQDQQRQGPVGRSPPTIHTAHQGSGPSHHHRQHEDVWPRQHMRRRQDDGRDHHEQRQAWRELAQQEERQQAKGERDRRGGDDDDARPAGQRVDSGVDHLREPFEGDPGRAVHRKGERVARRQGAMRHDPAPDLDVRIAVGIIEQPLSEDQHRGIDAKAHQPGERRTRRKRLNLAVHDLLTHGERNLRPKR
ncbi:hypothetical protein ACVJA9_004431 [Bradyrhizobium diazoefficiens]